MSIEQIQSQTPRQPATTPASQGTVVEQSRAIAEVAAAVRVAIDNPRDETVAVIDMRRACASPAMADRAFYSVPRAGGRIEGPSVHLARELARCYRNIDYGIRELSRDDDAGTSEMQAWAWDQQHNVRSSRSFIVPHDRMEGKGAAKRRARLTDLGDIANNNNSVAARAVRETIFTVLPVWFTEEAKDIAARTLRGETVTASGAVQAPQMSLADSIAQLVESYAQHVKVTRAELEAYVGLPVDDWSATTLAQLRVLAGELARGEKSVADEFGRDTTSHPEAITADDILGTP